MEPNPTSGSGPKLGCKTPYFLLEELLRTEHCWENGFLDSEMALIQENSSISGK